MDPDHNIYKAPKDEIPEEDKARLDGYLAARAEADAGAHRLIAKLEEAEAAANPAEEEERYAPEVQLDRIQLRRCDSDFGALLKELNDALRSEVKAYAALERLKEAVKPILAAHRSTEAHVTEEQITRAWEAFDAC